MAPELHLKKPYKGDQVDLFAAAIILFIMVAGIQPFQNAKSRNFHYKLIANNKPELFWGVHGKLRER